MILNWGPDPEIFHFNLIHLGVRWYGLMFMLSFLVGLTIMRRMFKKEGRSLEEVDTLLIYAFIGTILGARLGHVLFYDPGYYFSHPLEIVQIWKGGLASHGAAIGLFITLYLFSRKAKDMSYLWILDRTAIMVALAGFFIRLGNFFNSEIIGIPTKQNWGVIFNRIDSLPRHPAQLYESITYFILFIILFRLYKIDKIRDSSGLLLGIFLVGIFIPRFLIEMVKENQSAFEAGIPLNMGQLLSIPVILLGLYLIFLKNKAYFSAAVNPIRSSK